MEVARLLGEGDAVDLERVRGLQIDGGSGCQAAEFGVERELQRGEAVGHREFHGALGVGIELLQAVDHAAAHAVQRGGGDGDPDIPEGVGRCGPAIDEQGGADGECGRGAGQQGFARDVESGLQGAGFAGNGDALQRGEARGIADDDILLARFGGEGQQDDAIRAGVEASGAEERPCVFHRLAGFIEDREQGAGGRVPDKRSERALADEGAAALSGADELDDPDAAAVLEFRQGDAVPAAQERRIVEVQRAFAVRRKAVEIEVGVHLRAGGAVHVLRVDLIDLHEQTPHVLDGEIQRHLVGRRPLAAQGRREVHVHALAQGLIGFGGKERDPARGIRRAGDEPGLGMDGVQPPLVQPWSEGLGGFALRQQLEQQAADKGLVIADRLAA